MHVPFEAQIWILAHLEELKTIQLMANLPGKEAIRALHIEYFDLFGRVLIVDLMTLFPTKDE